MEKEVKEESHGKEEPHGKEAGKAWEDDDDLHPSANGGHDDGSFHHLLHTNSTGDSTMVNRSSNRILLWDHVLNNSNKEGYIGRFHLHSSLLLRGDVWEGRRREEERAQ